MNFICDVADFKYGFSIASRACPTRSALTALQYVKIEARKCEDVGAGYNEGEITFTGFDGSLSIQSSFTAELIESGTVLLDSKTLNSVLAQMTSTEKVQLTCKESGSNGNITVQLRCGALKYSFSSLDVGTFPEIPATSVSNTVTISPADLKAAIDAVIFAVSDNEARPIQTGVLFEVDGLELTTVALDGYRLALRKSKLISGLADDAKHSFVVPQKILKEVSRAVNTVDSESVVLIEVGDRSVTFITDGNGTTLSMPLLNGTFFDYRSTLSKSSSTKVTCRAQEAIECANSVAAILQANKQVPIKCNFKDKSLEISVTTPTGQAANTISISTEGEPVDIGFNVKYFLEALKAAKADCEEIKIGLSGPSAGAVITPNDLSDKFTYLVLPVRLRS